MIRINKLVVFCRYRIRSEADIGDKGGEQKTWKSSISERRTHFFPERERGSRDSCARTICSFLSEIRWDGQARHLQQHSSVLSEGPFDFVFLCGWWWSSSMWWWNKWAHAVFSLPTIILREITIPVPNFSSFFFLHCIIMEVPLVAWRWACQRIFGLLRPSSQLTLNTPTSLYANLTMKPLRLVLRWLLIIIDWNQSAKPNGGRHPCQPSPSNPN